jgi:hypothetical protein
MTIFFQELSVQLKKGHMNGGLAVIKTKLEVVLKIVRE